MRKSLRFQLTVALLVSFGILIITTLGLICFLVERSLQAQFDQGLKSKLRLLTMFPEVDRRGIDLEFTGHSMPEFEHPDSGEYYQIWLHDGRELSKSRSLGDMNLPMIEGTMNAPVCGDYTLPNGKAIRIIGVAFKPSPEDDYILPKNESISDFGMVLVFARDRALLDRLLARVRWGFVLIGMIVLPLTLLAVNRVLKKGLAPLGMLRKELENMEAGSLPSVKISTAGLPSELVPIATELNLLAGRLNDAFKREQRLTADMAHEMNTPLAELRMAAEVAAKWPDDPEATQQLARHTLDIVARIQQTTAQLMELARQEKSADGAEQRVIFCKLWKDVLASYRSAISEKKLVLKEYMPEDAEILTNPVLLSLIISNLLDNAVAYSPDGAVISCRFAVNPDGGWNFSLENPNTTLTTADLEHIFDPLWRLDQSRSDSKHSGLGLTLVQSSAARLGLDVRAFLNERGLFIVELVSSAAHQTNGDR